MKNLIVALADDNYVNQAKQLFSSIYFNSGWKGDYMLLSHNIPEKKLKWFRERGILIKKCKPLSDKPVGLRPWPATILSKFYLFQKDMKKWEHIIYLDTDIIVKGSLDELIKINGFAARIEYQRFGNNIQPLSRTFLKSASIKNKEDKKTLEELKRSYNLSKASFNAGVIVLKTSVLKDNTFSGMLALYRKYKNICCFSEQNIINLYFYKKIIKLPYIYHSWPEQLKYSYNIRPAKMQAAIFHFMDNHKPWSKDNYFYKEWKENLNKADLINLKKILPAREIWTEKEINEYADYLKKRHKIYFYKYLFWKLYFIIDKNIGKIGRLIKRMSPKLYSKPKRIQHGK